MRANLGKKGLLYIWQRRPNPNSYSLCALCAGIAFAHCSLDDLSQGCPPQSVRTACPQQHCDKTATITDECSSLKMELSSLFISEGLHGPSAESKQRTSSYSSFRKNNKIVRRFIAILSYLNDNAWFFFYLPSSDFSPVPSKYLIPSLLKIVFLFDACWLSELLQLNRTLTTVNHSIQLSGHL